MLHVHKCRNVSIWSHNLKWIFTNFYKKKVPRLTKGRSSRNSHRPTVPIINDQLQQITANINIMLNIHHFLYFYIKICNRYVQVTSRLSMYKQKQEWEWVVRFSCTVYATIWKYSSCFFIFNDYLWVLITTRKLSHEIKKNICHWCSVFAS